MNIIEVKKLSFAYEPAVGVLHEIDLTLRKGEFVGLVGANGSGKTTLMEVMYDLIARQKGHIRYFGEELSEGVKKKMMYLPSEDTLPDFLSGLEYVTMLCDFYDLVPNEQVLAQLLQNYQLEAAIGNLIKSYSHGMKKKLHLISGLIIAPELLIVDETINGLDFESKEITNMLLRQHVAAGNTVLLCTHELHFIVRAVDRLILLDKGTILADELVSENKERIDRLMNDLFKQIIAQRGVHLQYDINF